MKRIFDPYYREFDKYLEDWCKEHNINTLMYWSHYPGGGYWIWGETIPIDNRPEIPGYSKILMTESVHEKGIEFEVEIE